MIALSKEESDILKDIIKPHATDRPYQVIIFGSRINGCARKYSDVDITLFRERPMSFKVDANLAEAFDDSSSPYTVDIVDGRSASNRLFEEILRGAELMKL